MSLKQQLTDDMKAALRAHESERLGVIRFLLAEIKNSEIDGGSSDDASLQKIIASQVKKTQDAISDFQKAGRADLVTAETVKVKIMTAYLPAQLSNAQLTTLVTQVLADLGAHPNPGQAIGAVMKKVAGQADGARVSALVQKLLKK